MHLQINISAFLYDDLLILLNVELALDPVLKGLEEILFRSKALILKVNQFFIRLHLVFFKLFVPKCIPTTG